MEDEKLIDAGWNDTDSESGRSKCIFECSSHFDNRMQRRIRHKPSRPGQSSYMEVWPLIFNEQDRFYCQGRKP